MTLSLDLNVGRYGAPRLWSTGGKLRIIARCGSKKRVPPMPNIILLFDALVLSYPEFDSNNKDVCSLFTHFF
jgi:hypothetical protein